MAHTIQNIKGHVCFVREYINRSVQIVIPLRVMYICTLICNPTEINVQLYVNLQYVNLELKQMLTN